MTQGDFTVLLVSSPRSQQHSARILEDLRRHCAKVVSAESCFEARWLLNADPSVEFVITDASLADGNWYSVLASIVENGGKADLFVVTDRDDQSFQDRVRSQGGAGLIVRRPEGVATEQVLQHMRGQA
jgi:DNA-binding NarL/FixJ family response regulator